MNPLYLIDNSNFVYRYKSVHKYALVDVNGVKVNISPLVGYIKSIRGCMFTDICIVLDGDPVKNKALLSSYKGTRSHELEDNSIGVPRLEFIKFLTKLGERLGKNIRVVCAPYQEADQVVSSIAHIISGELPSRWQFTDKLNTKPLKDDKYLKSFISDDLAYYKAEFSNYDSVVIGSTDADMAQLQSLNNVLIDTSTSGKKVSDSRTADAVAQVNPLVIPAYKAIYGDDSDNIPSLKVSMKKQDVLNYLNKNIKTQSDLNLFYLSVVSTNFNTVVPIAKEIRNTNQVKEFQRNWDLTKLEFYSIPYVLEYTNYDIQTTIDKYRLRL